MKKILICFMILASQIIWAQNTEDYLLQQNLQAADGSGAGSPLPGYCPTGVCGQYMPGHLPRNANTNPGQTAANSGQSETGVQDK